MPQVSRADERLVVPGCPRDYRDRVYVSELAEFLHQGPHKLKLFAKKHGLLRKASGGPAHPGIYHVSAYAALRMIAYFRAQQTAFTEKEKRDFHSSKERSRLTTGPRLARLRAARAEAAAKSVLK